MIQAHGAVRGDEPVVDLAVIGGGAPAWAAAAAALGRGASVALLEQAPPVAPRVIGHLGAPIPAAVRDAVAPRLARHASSCSVWAIQDGSRVSYSVQQQPQRLVARRIILAEALRPRVVPFSGWHLDGVAFAADAHDAADAVRAVPAGSPAVLVGDDEALDAVRAVLRARGCPLPVALAVPTVRARRDPHGGPRATAGRSALAAAVGGSRLRELDVVDVDTAGAVVAGSERTIPAAALVCAFGSVPSVRLAAAAGCRLEVDVDREAWRVVRGARGESTVPSIFLAGDSGDAARDGDGAALAALAALASLAGDGDDRRVAAIADAPTNVGAPDGPHVPHVPHRGHAPVTPLRDVMAGMADVVVCPCEGVRLADVRRAVEGGLTELDDVKKATGCAMGLCQGATCDLLLAAGVGLLTSRSMQQIGPLKPRFPAAAMSLGELAGADGR